MSVKRVILLYLIVILHFEVIQIDLKIRHRVCPEDKFAILMNKVDEDGPGHVHWVDGLMALRQLKEVIFKFQIDNFFINDL